MAAWRFLGHPKPRYARLCSRNACATACGSFARALGRFSEDFPTEPVWLTSQSTNSLQKGVFLFAQTLITLLVRETTSEGEQMRRCFGWRHALPLLVAVVAVAVIPAVAQGDSPAFELVDG